MLPKNSLYPKKTVLKDLKPTAINPRSINAIEVADIQPGALPNIIHNDVRVLVNTSNSLFRMAARNGELQWSGLIMPNGIAILPAKSRSQLLCFAPCKLTILTIPRDVILNNAKEYSIAVNGQTLLNIFQVFESRTVSNLTKELIYTCQTTIDQKAIRFEALSKALVIMLLRKSIRVANDRTVNQNANSKTGHDFSLIFEYLSNNYQSNISTEDLARIAGKTRSHFSREFKAETGLPPHRYLVQYRIEKAISQMQGGQDSLTQISQNCGFADQSHFSKCFKRVTGVTPSSFIKK